MEAITNTYYSSIHSDIIDSPITRGKKIARQIIACLRAVKPDLDTKKLTFLDVGCANGLMPYILADHFKSAVGIDTDVPAIDYGQHHFKKKN